MALTPADLIDRRSMIEDLAAWYGTPKDCWTRFDQRILDVAWLYAREHWDV